MTTEMVQKILDYLKNTGEYLASEGFKIAYKQALFYGWSDIAWAGLFLILTLVFAYLFKRAYVWEPGGYSDDYDRNILLCLTVCGFIIFLVMIFVMLSFGMGWLINPELGAIRILMDFVK